MRQVLEKIGQLMFRNILLLSIRSEYADMIFEGTKKVELRRTRPRVMPGDIVVVYVPAPVKAVVGTFEVDNVVTDLPQELWGKVEHVAGITRDQYDRYYEGASKGFGIFLKRAKNLSEPLSLDTIRQQWSDFWPPQTYRYLTYREMRIFNEPSNSSFSSFVRNSEQDAEITFHLRLYHPLWEPIPAKHDLLPIADSPCRRESDYMPPRTRLNA